MNENIKKAVKITLQTQGWAYISKMFNDEFIDGAKATNFDTKGRSNEDIAREVTAREISAKQVNKVLSKLERIKNEPEKPISVVYK